MLFHKIIRSCVCVSGDGFSYNAMTWISSLFSFTLTEICFSSSNNSWILIDFFLHLLLLAYQASLSRRQYWFLLDETESHRKRERMLQSQLLITSQQQILFFGFHARFLFFSFISSFQSIRKRHIHKIKYKAEISTKW